MSKMKTEDRIVGTTDNKVMIKWDRLSEVLSKEEKIFMNKMLGKVIEYDMERLGLEY